MKLDSKNGSLTTLVPAGAAIVVGGLLIRRWLRDVSAPPQYTTGLPLFGPIIQFLKDPLILMRQGKKELGECFQVNFIAKNMIFLVGRDGQEFFFTMDKVLDQAKMYAFTIPIFGPNVLYDCDYSTRMCQLRFLRERLTDDSLESYCGILEEEVLQFFREEWGDSGVVDIRESMLECVTRTAIRCLMGEELRAIMHSNVKGHTICELLNILEQGLLPLSVFMPHLPIPRHKARNAARREMAEILNPIMVERRKKLASGEKIQSDDLLWKLMTATYPDGRETTDEEIVGFLVAAFFGGMHNSSITSAWATLEIVSRPWLATELLAEQRSVLGEDKAPFTFAAYEKMKKLRSAVMETLRRHPPLMLLMRTVEADTKFKQFTLRRGSAVAVSPNVGCEQPESFPDPLEFKPFRFLDAPPDEFAFIPFGGGRRLCKGQEFGYLQVMCVVSIMLRTYDLETLDGVTSPTIGEGMVLAPSQPCRVKYTKRA